MNSPTRIFAALLALLMLVPAAADAGKKKRKNVNVTVMTRNLYLGADIIKLATAENQNDFEQQAAAVFNTVRQTDFPSRAPLVAEEIRRTKPDFVGLQEVALWRSGPKDGTATQASNVEYDWLAELRKSLRDEGLRYRIVRVQDEFDFEAPSADGRDIRFTQQDAILMRVNRRIKARGVRSGNFDSSFQVPLNSIGRVADVQRGYVSLNATVRGAKFRFVNTHLEAYSEANGLAQAQELTERGGPARARGTTFLVGDMNSERGNPDNSDPIDHLLDFGFDDTFFRKTRDDTPTCCQAENLLNPASELATRIDFVLSKPRRPVVRSRVVGNDSSVRTASGLWTSDHAGVVSTIRLKGPRR